MIVNVIFIILAVLLDQITKFFVLTKMKPGESIPIIKNFFHITFVQNKGVAFGMLYGHVGVLVFVGLIAIVGIILYFHKKGEEYSILSRIGFIFIMSGAIGNFIDRVFRGFVIDFIDFRGIWVYIFNLADVWINIGVFFILIEYFFEKEKAEKEESK
ncbi:signal peptidase II [Haliovirga abyssi]|uniref:Lipoprotein signal peptidase n=1 Tax=Haliovirga abyssi TaxID=2996794 RepID=A0AAU9DPH9_9FUSO|nr:signal peptidase II [Haliovirga abyssi]BDU50338.1 lipoprotein signal peptidase [Haliovirga abyssi]